MPISHKYKIIFVHIPKTGGSSIERALGIYGVNNSGNNLQVNEDILFGQGLQHLTMSKILLRMGHDICDRYFKFAFVRNPWDRALSAYRWRRTWDKNFFKMSFAEFVKDELSNNLKNSSHYRPQIEFIVDDPSFKSDYVPLVDYVGRFENLRGDFQQVVERCQLGDIELSNINKSPLLQRAHPIHSIKAIIRKGIARIRYPKNKDYRFEYNSQTCEIISKIYHTDIHAFGYDF